MSADAAARLAVIDPEAANRRIGVAEGLVVVAQRVREAARVEVEAQAPVLGPVDPALEVLGPDLVARDRPIRLEVDRAQVEPLLREALARRGLGEEQKSEFRRQKPE